MKKVWFVDGYGFPVVTIKGRPIINFIRRLLWTRKITTVRPKCLEPKPTHDGLHGSAAKGD